MTEWIWLNREVVFALHDRLVAEFGGASGIRDVARFEAGLARPAQCFQYGTTDLYALAASYAVAIIQGHPFIDGNKRTSFVCAVVFLALNGMTIKAAELDAIVQTIALASGKLSEAQYTDWLRKNASAL